jgi:glycosyltransferase involved in cell wall biosynthesis
VKVLHVVFSYPPDPMGGTEVYVAGLARALATRSVETVIAAPDVEERTYQWDGLTVRRFASAVGQQSLDVVYGGGDPIASASFARVLDDVRPDVVHQHALSPACSADLVRIAKQRGLPVVFTYHTPTVTCQRGTLLYMGRDACAGDVDLNRCTGCVLDDLSLNSFVRWIVAAVPSNLGRAMGRRGMAGGIWTALRMTALMEIRVRELRELLRLVDRFVAPSPWVSRVLRANGVAADRILESPHGVDVPGTAAPRSPRDGTVRLAHLGRLDPVKGTALLLQAFSAVASPDVRLDVFGVVQDGRDRSVRDDLASLCAADPRVRLMDSIPHEEVVDRLREYDAVLVPSQWMETGPLVVLEAFAAGVPVVGSSLGGLAEKIQDDVNGLLVSPFDSKAAWTSALERCLTPGLLPRLRGGMTPLRSVAAVADEMETLYAALAPRSLAVEVS